MSPLLQAFLPNYATNTTLDMVTLKVEQEIEHPSTPAPIQVNILESNNFDHHPVTFQIKENGVDEDPPENENHVECILGL